jgi:imidazole glycerol-phosphate synthase subunit HisH
VATIAVIDYGMGNLRSVEKALEHVGADARRCRDPRELAGAEGLILPGVGAFPEAMRRIGERGFAQALREHLAAGTPLLGVCLGMQLLFDSSVEHGGADGLGLLAGKARPLRSGRLKLPHIGWSPVRSERPSPLTAGLAPDEPFYFVHSLAVDAAPGDVIGSAVYGERFAAIVGRGRVFGTQFHPEKSSSAGLRMLANFDSICAPATLGSRGGQ